MTNITHERKPIFLDPNTMLCINVYHAEGGWDDLWMSEYIDHYKDVHLSARQFVSNLSDLFSVRMLWELREALAEEIARHNAEFGSDFPVDKPADE